MFVSAMVKDVAHDAKNAFFTELPADWLTEEEEKLLSLIKEMSIVIQSLLPKGVSLQDWAERRIPLEAVADANASGLVYVHSVHSSAPRAGTASARIGDMVNAASCGGRGNQEGKKSAGKGNSFSSGRRPEIPKQPNCELSTSADGFFAGLPVNEFLPAEVELRCRLLAFVTGKRSHGADRGKRRTFLSRWEEIAENAAIRDAAIPPEVRLQDWIERRIGSEIVIQYDDRQQPELFACKDPQEHAQRIAITEEFLQGLPDGHFIEEEETLRGALLDFLKAWQGKAAPTLSDVGMDKAVQRARKACLPDGVPLRDWCECRIGEEVELQKNEKCQYSIAIREHHQPQSWSRKRKAEQH